MGHPGGGIGQRRRVGQRPGLGTTVLTPDRLFRVNERVTIMTEWVAKAEKALRTGQPNLAVLYMRRGLSKGSWW